MKTIMRLSPQSFQNMTTSVLWSLSLTTMVLFFFNSMCGRSFKPKERTLTTNIVAQVESTQQHPPISESDIRLQRKNMILVKGGKSTMGNDKGYAGERPAHIVRVDDFYIDQHEVTVREYKAFCSATSRKMPSPPAWGRIDNHPMVNVSWIDAVAYAKLVGKRLPTEAE